MVSQSGPLRDTWSSGPAGSPLRDAKDRVSVRGVSKPDGADGQESVWARLEREGREDAKRARGPQMLIWTAFTLSSIAILVPTLGLPDAAFWAVISLALSLTIAGLIGYWCAVADRETRDGVRPLSLSGPLWDTPGRTWPGYPLKSLSGLSWRCLSRAFR